MYGPPPSSGSWWKRGLLGLMVLGVLAGIGYYVYLLVKGETKIGNIELSPEPEGVSKDSGSSKAQLPSTPSTLQEVFFVSRNEYTYDDAPAVCAVYDADLATYEQVEAAHAKGAEWCGYGWTLGGMALFPTQESSWARLQKEVDQDKRTKCGRPGINGGYFDPNTKFGVNCFGIKPACNNKTYPIGDKTVDSAKVNALKQNSGRIKVDPFNRNAWSMWGTLA